MFLCDWIGFSNAKSWFPCSFRSATVGYLTAEEYVSLRCANAKQISGIFWRGTGFLVRSRPFLAVYFNLCLRLQQELFDSKCILDTFRPKTGFMTGNTISGGIGQR